MDESTRKICLDMMEETFLRDEPLCGILGINDDPVSIATIRANWEAYVSGNTSLACFTEEDGQPKDLVGFNIVVVKSKDDEEEDFEKPASLLGSASKLSCKSPTGTTNKRINKQTRKEDLMKAVRKVADNKKLESKLDYKPV